MLKKQINSIRRKHGLPFLGILCLIGAYASAQTYLSTQSLYGFYNVVDLGKNSVPPVEKDSVGKRSDRTNTPVKKIEIIKSDTLFKHLGAPDITILRDSVILYHDGATLYCDSAYYNQALSCFDAFGRVEMNQGDTIFMYGNYMHYDGNTQIVYVRENVRLEKDSLTLFTDSLNYDRILNLGYYFDGGMLVDPQNELSSFWGQYEPNRNIALFKDSVRLVNPQFVLTSDTLKYSTNTHVAYIVSPTEIVSDSGKIYTRNGWYNTETQESMLLDQSLIVNKDGNRFLRGDSMIYYKDKGYGEVFGNMYMQDTMKRIILRGHYGIYEEFSGYAMATDSAYCIEYSQKDSLYLHADTLRLIPDSTYRQLKAYHNVRIYRADLQAICDSLQFNSRDSILRLYQNPALWSEGRQLTGDTIYIFMNDSTIDYTHIRRNAFSIEQKDSIHFNQLKGTSLKLFFDEGAIRRVFAEGNVETIAYPEEKDKSLTGIRNLLQAGYLDISVKDNAFERLVAWPAPKGVATPFHLMTSDKYRLKDFYWYDYLRPLNKDDIFRPNTRKAGDVPPPRSNIWEHFDKEFNN